MKWNMVGIPLHLELMKIKLNIGVHQIWGRIPAEIDTIQSKDAVGSCFPHSPCLQNLFSLGL